MEDQMSLSFQILISLKIENTDTTVDQGFTYDLLLCSHSKLGYPFLALF